MTTAPKDIFMNFKELTVTSDAADSTVLVEADVDTGLTIRGGLAWLIHLVEFEFDFGKVTASMLTTALSIIRNSPAMPTYGDNGLIAKRTIDWYYATNGGGITENPSVHHYLPPIPIAAPNLALYFQTSINVVQYKAKPIHARVGYTTVKLDAKTYLEIAEAWGQGT